jgi:hypothetical protein
MAQYYKLNVTLDAEALESGVLSTQRLEVVVPTIGPAGPQGNPGEVGPAGTTDYTQLDNVPSTFTPSEHTHELADLDSSGIAAGKFLQADGNDGAQWDDVTDADVPISAATASGFPDGSGIYYPISVTLNSRRVFKLNKTYGMFFEASKWHIFENVPITANILYSSNTTTSNDPWGNTWADGDVDQTVLADSVAAFADQFGFVGDDIPSTSVTGLGTAAASDTGDFAAASHTHGNLSNDGKIGTTSGLPLKTGTDGVVEAGAFGTGAGEFCEGDDARLSDDRNPLSHASSHAAAGSDPIAPSDIGAQSLFTTTTTTVTGNVTISAARALIYQAVTTSVVTADISLPSSGHQAGDVIVVRSVTPFAASTVLTIKSGVGATLDTITDTNQSFRYIASSSSPAGWAKVPVDTHTHTAADITDLNSAAAGGLFDAALSITGAVVTDANLRLTNDDGHTVVLDYQAATTDRFINLPDANGTLALTSDFAAPPAIGSTTPAAGSFTTLTANNGTLTASAPVLDLGQTWNNAAVTFTGLLANFTNTASAAASLLMDLQVGGTSQFRIGRTGIVTANRYNFGQTDRGFTTNGAQIFLGDAAVFSWIVGGGGTGTFNTGLNVLRAAIRFGGTDDNSGAFLKRDSAANILCQENGTNAQTFNIYNTFTSATNHERGFLRWSSSNVFQIGTEKGSGGGTARALEFHTDNIARWFIGGGSGALQAQGAFAIEAGSHVRCAFGSTFQFGSGRSRMASSATGIIALLNAAENDFNRLQFGGTTSSFPALKRDTTSLQARLADDSAFTAIQGKLTTETAYTAGAPTATGYLVLYDSNGTAYKVPAEAL